MLSDVHQDFRDLLNRDLSEYEYRMIRRAYIMGLAYGVTFANERMEDEVEKLLGESELNGKWC